MLTTNSIAAPIAAHARPRGAALSHAPWISLESLLFCAMFFWLPVSFSVPSRISLTLPSTVLGLILIGLRIGDSRGRTILPGFLPLLLVPFVLATLSYLVNAQKEHALSNYLAGYTAALVIYLAVRLHRPTVAEAHRGVILLSVSAMIPLTWGMCVFYATFGIPDLPTLMSARFMEYELAPYRAVTWGNVGNTATILVQLAPLCFANSVDRLGSRRRRAWYFACLLVCGVNLLIVGSRSAFLVLPLALTTSLIFFRKRVSKVLVGGTIALIVGAVQYLNGDDGRFWQYMHGATSIHSGDQSVVERLDSICEGWEVMWEHATLGVGPGCSLHHISYDAAHQMSVQHGVELGVLGMVANVLLVVAILWRTGEAFWQRRQTAESCQCFTMLISASAFVVMGSIANAPLCIGAVNPWGTILAATLALADLRRSASNSSVPSRLSLASKSRRPLAAIS